MIMDSYQNSPDAYYNQNTGVLRARVGGKGVLGGERWQ